MSESLRIGESNFHPFSYTSFYFLKMGMKMMETLD